VSRCFAYAYLQRLRLHLPNAQAALPIQVWTIFIHDGDMIHGSWWEKYINSPAHHTLHHLYFTCNYGQYFTWADSYYDSYREPEDHLDPLHAAIAVMQKKGLADADGNPIEQKKKHQ
jgi:lathosterol oxidase